MLEGETTDRLLVANGERSDAQRGYRSGRDSRQLKMKVGTIELRVLLGDIETALKTTAKLPVIERDRRAENALASILAEMYVNGIGTRRLRSK